jgi:hypothetical protein
MSEIFRIRIKPEMAMLMTRQQLRGAWEAAVLEQGATVVPGGVTVRVLPSGGAVVAGRAER